MANEEKKDFNAMLQDSKDMPKFQIITDQKSIEKYGGSKMYFAPPIDYDKVMKRVPYGKSDHHRKNREYFCQGKRRRFYRAYHSRDFCIHCSVGQLSACRRRNSLLADTKGNGELNAKYPGGIEAQKEKLEAEGHIIIQKGRKNLKYYVKDYERVLLICDKRY